MKIKSIAANNRRKAFEIVVGQRNLLFPFAKLRLKPTGENRIEEVFVDADLGNEGFSYRLEDGSEDTIHVDSVLEYNEDPGYMRDLLLHKLTVEAKHKLAEAEISSREVIRRLGTSASQFYRLLDETNHKKSFGQLFDLFHILGCEVQVEVKARKSTRVNRRKHVA